ncbi:unnamed protein product [Parascedosporium putredinis]|uniref:P-loop containing nucleoside triphosphate hydrolase protein n=1 Tax=Parascedosporium putredinis TaxID=1442378 RepID=A0A9P1H1P3_9PEZI|nr:unnamed protein product [Parascedosporium putredinis]CAI7993972.1 unnamed protein product [Parascedosporium putredinis]
MDSVLLCTLLVASLSIPATIYSPHARKRLQAAIASSERARDVKLLAEQLRPRDRQEARMVARLLVEIFFSIAAVQTVSIATPLLLRSFLAKIPDIRDGSRREGTFPLMEISAYVFLKHVASGYIRYYKWDRTYRLQTLFTDRITIGAYTKLLSLSADYHDAKNSGTVWMTVRGTGKGVARMLHSILFEFGPSLLDMAVGIAGFKTLGSTRAALATVVVVILYGVVILRSSSRKTAYESRAARMRGRRDHVGSDAILNWWTIFCFGRLNQEAERHATAVREMREIDAQYVADRSTGNHLKQLVSSGGLLLLCILVGYDIWNTPGRSGADLVVLMGFWQQVFSPVQEILNWKQTIDTFFIDTRKLIDIFEEEPSVKDVPEAADLRLTRGTIEFQNTSFAYGGKEKPALDDVSFTIEGGKTLALVGQTGGGKSTTLKLLMRAYDPSSGRILIDGQDISLVRKQSLMDHIGIVPQSIGVFNTTILENLRYGKPDATLEECQEACRAVCLHDKIASFELGYEEVVGERGSKLSGGELQRLATARLLLRDPKIALFDEAMSSLDSGTEAKIQEYLQTWSAGRTVVMVAHRLVTIVHADLILAVKNGQIVERGTHEELLAKGGYYYELWYKQHPFSADGTRQLG